MGEMYSADVSSVGLIADLVGAVLLFKYGLPGELNTSGTKYAVYNECTPEEKAFIARAKWLSKTGLTLLIVGFALQLVGSVAGRASSGALTGPAQSLAQAPSNTGNGASAESEPTRKP